MNILIMESLKIYRLSLGILNTDERQNFEQSCNLRCNLISIIRDLTRELLSESKFGK